LIFEGGGGTQGRAQPSSATKEACNEGKEGKSSIKEERSVEKHWWSSGRKRIVGGELRKITSKKKGPSWGKQRLKLPLNGGKRGGPRKGGLGRRKKKQKVRPHFRGIFRGKKETLAPIVVKKKSDSLWTGSAEITVGNFFGQTLARWEGSYLFHFGNIGSAGFSR